MCARTTGCTYYSYCTGTGERCCEVGNGPVRNSIEKFGTAKYWINSVIIGNRSVKLKQTFSAKCLDSNNLSEVYIHESNLGDYQVWTVYNNADGSIFLKNAATGFFLDSDDNGRAYAVNFNGGDYQKWNYKDNFLINFKTSKCLNINDAVGAETFVYYGSGATYTTSAQFSK